VFQVALLFAEAVRSRWEIHCGIIWLLL